MSFTPQTQIRRIVKEYRSQVAAGQKPTLESLLPAAPECPEVSVLCVIQLMPQYKELRVANEGAGDNYVTQNLIGESGCVEFWNRDGIQTYILNILKVYGDEKTHKHAYNTPYPDWVKDMILSDIGVFATSDIAQELGIKFEYGRTSSHVWFHENGKRTLMFHTEENYS